jgi:hypothetical protein
MKFHDPDPGLRFRREPRVTETPFAFRIRPSCARRHASFLTEIEMHQRVATTISSLDLAPAGRRSQSP